MEVFTFLKMTESSPSVPSRPGADGADRIDVIAIAGKDGTAASQGQARQQIAKEFKNFNAAKAQCFKVEDREKLLAVIEAAFGDFKEFNQCVRDVFAERTVASSMLRLPVARACLASGGAPEAASVDAAAQQVEVV